MSRFDATYMPVSCDQLYIFLSSGIQIMKRNTSYFKPFTPDEEEVYELKQTQSSRRSMADSLQTAQSISTISTLICH